MAEKWIPGLEPGLAVSDAARLVLAARLAVVDEYLPLAIHEPYRDIENVHQLRVGTRRADAAVRIFRDCLKRPAYKVGRGRLRAIRRAAGEARDWDVFLAGMEERATGAPKPELAGLDFLSAYALGQRHAAQPALEALDGGEPVSPLANEVRAADGEGTFEGLARPMIEKRLGELAEAASGDVNDYAVLHGVRIAGKRLRYAMEVCSPCFGPAFRERLYPLVEEMQEVLGLANDSHVAVGRLTGLRALARTHPAAWERAKAGVEALIRFHRRRLPQERKRFLAWWKRWQGLEMGEMLG